MQLPVLTKDSCKTSLRYILKLFEMNVLQNSFHFEKERRLELFYFQGYFALTYFFRSILDRLFLKEF